MKLGKLNESGNRKTVLNVLSDFGKWHRNGSVRYLVTRKSQKATSVCRRSFQIFHTKRKKMTHTDRQETETRETL